MRLQVGSLALLSGSRIRCCRELCLGRRHGLDLLLLWLWRRLAAAAPIRPLGEPPYAMGAALERQKAKKKKVDISFRILLLFYFSNDFYFFHYSWFTVFCPLSTIQQSDPVTHTYIHSFSHILLHQAPS